jgi:anti-anti-sigma regulatory factor
LMYGNPTFECAGAQIRGRCRQLATVVTVNGDIDSVNIDRVTEYTRRFILTEKPFVLDLSGVNSFSPQSVSLLYTLDEGCFNAGVEWSLIASQAVLDALRIGDRASFPMAPSVPEALHQFAETIDQRRRLLPLLTKKSA